MRAKKGIVHIIDPLLVLAPIMMDIFQELRIDSKVFFEFLKHNRFYFSWFANDKLIEFSALNLFSRNEVIIYHVSKTYA